MSKLPAGLTFSAHGHACACGSSLPAHNTSIHANATQGGREVCRGHWIDLQTLVLFWAEWQQDIASHIAAQAQLQGIRPRCCLCLHSGLLT